jgi:hypothetical protein
MARELPEQETVMTLCRVIGWLDVSSTVQYCKVQQIKIITIATYDSNIKTYIVKIYHFFVERRVSCYIELVKEAE